MKNSVKICFVLVVGILALVSAQVAPSQITRFMYLDGWDDTLFGITHDLKSSPIIYDTTADADEGEIPAGRIMQPLAPSSYFSNEFTSYGSLTFDYDSANKVVYLASVGLWTIHRINIDGSGFEPAFSSEYVFVKHLIVDYTSNTAYFSAYALDYVNRTAIMTEGVFFSSSTLSSTKLAYVVVKANLLTGETEELFNSLDMKALVFNSKYNLMFLVGTDDIEVMTLDRTVVDVIPLPLLMSAIQSSVLYDREEDVIYVADYSAIFYLRYATQESGRISVSGSISTGYVWHDAVNKAFYFMAVGSGASVYHLGYESFESLISRNAYTATPLFQITQSAYGLFAIACDSTSVGNCGWNTSGLPSFMVAAIVLLIILPCAGCIGFIVAACNRRELKFPVDQWANMPLNREPDNNAPEH